LCLHSYWQHVELLLKIHLLIIHRQPEEYEYKETGGGRTKETVRMHRCQTMMMTVMSAHLGGFGAQCPLPTFFDLQ